MKKLLIPVILLILFSGIGLLLAANQGYFGYGVSNSGIIAKLNSGSASITTSVSKIEEWGICKTVTSTDSRTLFIPTKTAKERTGFIASKPSYVTLSECGCTTDSDCGTGLVCIPAGCSGIIDPCAMSNTSGYIIGTNVKINGCAIYSYGPPRLIYGILFNTGDIIPLDGGITNNNFGDDVCKSYYTSLCKTLTNYTGSSIDRVYIESSTPDKRVTTTTCGSDKTIVSGRTNTDAIKNITCYYSSFSCNTITSSSVCSNTVGCTRTPTGICVIPTCGSANGESFDSLTSISPNLCSIGSATNFVQNTSTSRSRNCGSATCSAHKNTCNGFGTNPADCSNRNCGAPGNPSCSDVICHANQCNSYFNGICSQYMCSSLKTESECLAKEGCSWN